MLTLANGSLKIIVIHREDRKRLDRLDSWVEWPVRQQWSLAIRLRVRIPAARSVCNARPGGGGFGRKCEGSGPL